LAGQQLQISSPVV